MALVRTDPYRELDRMLGHLWGQARSGTQGMPMDAYRRGDEFVVHFDLPGVDPDRVELTVEDDVLTVHAERLSPWTTEGVDTLVAERPFGKFSRQVLLGSNLDTEKISATYEDGVLTLTIPVAARAKPRRITIATEGRPEVVTS